MSLPPGLSVDRSLAYRAFLDHTQGLVRDSGRVGQFTSALEGAIDSKAIPDGTVLAWSTASDCYVVYRGAVCTSPTIAASKGFVFVDSIGLFAIGDNVKAGKPGAHNIFDSVEIDLGAIQSIYPSSYSFHVNAAAVVSDVVANDYVFIEPGTADGTGDPVAVLYQPVTLRTEAGVAADKDAEVLLGGFLKSAQVYGLCARAKVMLAGGGVTAGKSLFRFDS